MARIAIIVGHPRKDTFCEQLGIAYQRGAKAGGHSAELFVTSHMNFDPVLREGFVKIQPLEPDLAAAHDAILAADHLVLIFPLWLGDMPAIFKGFLERVLQPDLVEAAKEGKFLPILKRKSVRIIVTMGMPGPVFRWWFGAHVLKIMKRNMLGFLGAGPVRSTILGRIEDVTNETRQRWLDDAAALGRFAN